MKKTPKQLFSLALLSSFIWVYVLCEPLLAVQQGGSSAPAGFNRTKTLCEQPANTDKQYLEFNRRIKSFILPRKYGKVVKSFYGTRDKLVIHIYDLHCNPRAQQNISEIVNYLDNNSSIKGIYTEGAPRGAVDLKALSALGDSRTREPVLNDLLELGLLGGLEYYCALNGRENLYGLENAGVYDENIARLKKLFGKKPRARSAAAFLNKRIKELNGKYASKKLRAAERSLIKPDEADNYSEKYYLELERLCSGLGLDMSRYENISKYVKLLKLQARSDPRGAQKEFRGFLNGLKDRIPYPAYKYIAEKLEVNLAEACLAISQASIVYAPELRQNYPAMNIFLQLQELGGSLNAVELLTEQKNLLYGLLNAFCENETDKELSFMLFMGLHLTAYAGLEMSREEYLYFKRNEEKFKALLAVYSGDELTEYAVNTCFGGDISGYYETNYSRDGIFYENFTAQARGLASSEGPAAKTVSDPAVFKTNEAMYHLKEFPEIHVVVTGGFHSGFARLLEKDNISYLCVVPDTAEGLDNNRYEELISGKLDPRRYAAAETVFSSKQGQLRPPLNLFKDNEKALEVFLLRLAKVSLSEGQAPPLIERNMKNWLDSAGKGNTEVYLKKAGRNYTLGIGKQEYTISAGKKAPDWKAPVRVLKAAVNAAADVLKGFLRSAASLFIPQASDALSHTGPVAGAARSWRLLEKNGSASDKQTCRFLLDTARASPEAVKNPEILETALKDEFIGPAADNAAAREAGKLKGSGILSSAKRLVVLSVVPVLAVIAACALLNAGGLNAGFTAAAGWAAAFKNFAADNSVLWHTAGVFFCAGVFLLGKRAFKNKEARIEPRPEPGIEEALLEYEMDKLYNAPYAGLPDAVYLIGAAGKEEEDRYRKYIAGIDAGLAGRLKFIREKNTGNLWGCLAAFNEIRASGAERALIIDASGTDFKTASAPAGKTVSPLALSLLSGIRDCQSLKESGRRGSVIKRADNALIGSGGIAGNITLGAVMASTGRVRQEGFPVAVKNGNGRIIKIFRNFSEREYISKLEKNRLNRLVPNSSAKQNCVYTGDVIISFKNNAEYEGLLEIFSRIYSLSSSVSAARAPPDFDLLEHFIIPLAALSNEEDPFSYLMTLNGVLRGGDAGREFYLSIFRLYRDLFSGTQAREKFAVTGFVPAVSLFARGPLAEDGSPDSEYTRIREFLRGYEQQARPAGQKKENIEGVAPEFLRQIIKNPESRPANADYGTDPLQKGRNFYLKEWERLLENYRRTKDTVYLERIIETANNIMLTTRFSRDMFGPNDEPAAALYRDFVRLSEETIRAVNSKTAVYKAFGGGSEKDEILKKQFILYGYYGLEYLKALDAGVNLLVLTRYVLSKTSFLERVKIFKYSLLEWTRKLLGIAKGIRVSKEALRGQAESLAYLGNAVLPGLYSYQRERMNIEEMIKDAENPKYSVRMGMAVTWKKRGVLSRFTSTVLALRSSVEAAVPLMFMVAAWAAGSPVPVNDLVMSLIFKIIIPLAAGIGLTIYLHKSFIKWGRTNTVSDKYRKLLDAECPPEIAKMVSGGEFQKADPLRASVLYLRQARGGLAGLSRSGKIKQGLLKLEKLQETIEKRRMNADSAGAAEAAASYRSAVSDLLSGISKTVSAAGFRDAVESSGRALEEIAGWSAEAETIGGTEKKDVIFLCGQEFEKWENILGAEGELNRRDFEAVYKCQQEIIRLSAFSAETLKQPLRDGIASVYERMMGLNRETFRRAGLEKTEAGKAYLSAAADIYEYTVRYSRMLGFVYNIETLAGYRIPENSRWHILETIGLMKLVRAPFLMSFGLAMSRKMIFKEAARVSVLGNTIKENMYYFSGIRNILQGFYDAKLSPKYFELGLKYKWPIRKMLSRLMALILVFRPLATNLITGAPFDPVQFLISFATGLGVAFMFHWIPIFQSLVGFKSWLALRGIKKTAPKKKRKDPAAFVLNNEYENIGAALSGKMPDMVIITASNETDKAFYENLFERRCVELEPVPFKCVVSRNMGSGMTFLDSFDDSVLKDDPRFKGIDKSRLKIVVVNADGLERNNLLKLLPLRVKGRYITSLELAVINGIKAVQNLGLNPAGQERGGRVVIDPQYAYFGPIQRTGNITVVGSEVSYGQVLEQSMTMFVSEENRMQKAFHNFNASKIEDILAKKAVKGMFDLNNKNIKQMNALAGITIFSFDEPGEYAEFAGYINGLGKAVRQMHRKSAPPGPLDFLSHFFIPLTMMASGQNIYTFYSKLMNFSGNEPGAEPDSGSREYYWRLFRMNRELFDKMRLEGVRINSFVPPFSVCTAVNENNAQRQYYKKQAQTLSAAAAGSPAQEGNGLFDKLYEESIGLDSEMLAYAPANIFVTPEIKEKIARLVELKERGLVSWEGVKIPATFFKYTIETLEKRARLWMTYGRPLVLKNITIKNEEGVIRYLKDRNILRAAKDDIEKALRAVLPENLPGFMAENENKWLGAVIPELPDKTVMFVSESEDASSAELTEKMKNTCRKIIWFPIGKAPEGLENSGKLFYEDSAGRRELVVGVRFENAVIRCRALSERSGDGKAVKLYLQPLEEENQQGAAKALAARVNSGEKESAHDFYRHAVWSLIKEIKAGNAEADSLLAAAGAEISSLSRGLVACGGDEKPPEPEENSSGAGVVSRDSSIWFKAAAPELAGRTLLYVPGSGNEEAGKITRELSSMGMKVMELSGAIPARDKTEFSQLGYEDERGAHGFVFCVPYAGGTVLYKALLGRAAGGIIRLCLVPLPAEKQYIKNDEVLELIRRGDRFSLRQMFGRSVLSFVKEIENRNPMLSRSLARAGFKIEGISPCAVMAGAEDLRHIIPAGLDDTHKTDPGLAKLVYINIVNDNACPKEVYSFLGENADATVYVKSPGADSGKNYPVISMFHPLTAGSRPEETAASLAENYLSPLYKIKNLNYGRDIMDTFRASAGLLAENARGKTQPVPWLFVDKLTDIAALSKYIKTFGISKLAVGGLSQYMVTGDLLEAVNSPFAINPKRIDWEKTATLLKIKLSDFEKNNLSGLAAYDVPPGTVDDQDFDNSQFYKAFIVYNAFKRDPASAGKLEAFAVKYPLFRAELEKWSEYMAAWRVNSTGAPLMKAGDIKAVIRSNPVKFSEYKNIYLFSQFAAFSQLKEAAALASKAGVELIFEVHLLRVPESSQVVDNPGLFIDKGEYLIYDTASQPALKQAKTLISVLHETGASGFVLKGAGAYAGAGKNAAEVNGFLNGLLSAAKAADHKVLLASDSLGRKELKVPPDIVSLVSSDSGSASARREWRSFTGPVYAFRNTVTEAIGSGKYGFVSFPLPYKIDSYGEDTDLSDMLSAVSRASYLSTDNSLNAYYEKGYAAGMSIEAMGADKLRRLNQPVIVSAAEGRGEITAEGLGFHAFAEIHRAALSGGASGAGRPALSKAVFDAFDAVCRKAGIDLEAYPEFFGHADRLKRKYELMSWNGSVDFAYINAELSGFLQGYMEKVFYNEFKEKTGKTIAGYSKTVSRLLVLLDSFMERTESGDFAGLSGYSREKTGSVLSVSGVDLMRIVNDYLLPAGMYRDARSILDECSKNDLNESAYFLFKYIQTVRVYYDTAEDSGKNDFIRELAPLLNAAVDALADGKGPGRIDTQGLVRDSRGGKPLDLQVEYYKALQALLELNKFVYSENSAGYLRCGGYLERLEKGLAEESDSSRYYNYIADDGADEKLSEKTIALLYAPVFDKGKKASLYNAINRSFLTPFGIRTNFFSDTTRVDLLKDYEPYNPEGARGIRRDINNLARFVEKNNYLPNNFTADGDPAEGPEQGSDLSAAAALMNMLDMIALKEENQPAVE